MYEKVLVERKRSRPADEDLGGRDRRPRDLEEERLQQRGRLAAA
jgi:hypothetical protein